MKKKDVRFSLGDQTYTLLSLNISDLPLFPHFARLLLFILGLLNLLCVTVTKLDSNTDLEYAVA